MEERMRIIFPELDLQRIKFIKEDYLMVNVHGLSINKMVRLLKNISCLNRNGFTMRIIHGFNHGTKLKDAIRKEKLFTRNYLVIPDRVNPGITVLLFE